MFKIIYTGSSKIIKSIVELLNRKAEIGTTHETAGYGDESRAAYEHSLLTSGNPHRVTAADLGLENVLARLDAIQLAIGMITSWVTHKDENVLTHDGDYITFHGVSAENYNYLT